MNFIDIIYVSDMNNNATNEVKIKLINNIVFYLFEIISLFRALYLYIQVKYHHQISIIIKKEIN